jgi:hypothetical protein
MIDDHMSTLRSDARAAALELCRLLIDNIDWLTELAIDRATTIGVAEYGDTSFHKPLERLEVDVDEELADALFYQCLVRRARVASDE